MDSGSSTIQNEDSFFAAPTGTKLVKEKANSDVADDNSGQYSKNRFIQNASKPIVNMVGPGISGTSVAAEKSKEVAKAAAEAVMKKTKDAESRVEKLPLCLQKCCLCCCCWTAKGLLELVTNEETIQFALGFIIGEAFGALVTSIVNNVVSPVVVAIGSPGWTIGYSSGRLIIANPGKLYNPEGCVVPDNSYEMLVSECNVVSINLIGQQGFFTDILQFTITMITVYWVINSLRTARKRQRFRQKAEAADNPETKQCVMCLSSIPIKALRCSNCTSFQRPQDARKYYRDHLWATSGVSGPLDPEIL